MGYHNEVALVIRKELYSTTPQEFKAELKDCDKVIETSTAYIFRWDMLDGYNHFKKLTTLTDFVELNNRDCGFIRIGEDMDDMDRRGNTYDLGLLVIRTIDIDGEESEINPDTFFSNANQFIKTI